MTQIRRPIILITFTVGLTAMLAHGMARAQSLSAPERHRTISLTSQKIDVPFGNKTFAGGDKDAKIANEHCLLCHSKDMIDMQPPLPLETWKKEINKMHTAYGCPLRADETDRVAVFVTHAASTQAADGD
jgi:hypothetical protein